jgi:hypothetical protein
MCNYCEGDNQSRSNIMYDVHNNPISIWTEGDISTLLLDDGESIEERIYFCPICGRKL